MGLEPYLTPRTSGLYTDALAARAMALASACSSSVRSPPPTTTKLVSLGPSAVTALGFASTRAARVPLLLTFGLRHGPEPKTWLPDDTKLIMAPLCCAQANF